MATKKAPKAAKRTKTTKAAKAAARDFGGRPTKYQPAYAEQARKLALLGQTDKQMADFFDIGEATLHRWKLEHEGFRESIRAGKERADADIAASLYKTALGGSVVIEVREEPGADGGIVTKRTMRELPADVRAQRYWLGNRHPKLWRDKVVIEDETPADITQKADVFVTIMASARERQRQILIERGLADDEKS